MVLHKYIYSLALDSHLIINCFMSPGRLLQTRRMGLRSMVLALLITGILPVLCKPNRFADSLSDSSKAPVRVGDVQSQSNMHIDGG